MSPKAQKYPEKKTTQSKFKQVSKVLALWLKNYTKFFRGFSNLLEGLYSVKFDEGDVGTGIEKCYMEMYGSKNLKVQALGKFSQKASVPILESDMEWKKNIKRSWKRKFKL